MMKFVSLCLMAVIVGAVANGHGGAPQQGPPRPPPPHGFNNDTQFDQCDLGLCVNVIGKSGKIAVHVEAHPKNHVVIQIDSIGEYSMPANGGAPQAVQGKSTQSMANQEFFFSKLRRTQLYGSPAAKFFITSKLTWGANLTVECLILKEAVNVTNGNETLMLPKGAMKFNTLIHSWNFANADNKIMLDIEIKGNGSPKSQGPMHGPHGPPPMEGSGSGAHMGSGSHAGSGSGSHTGSKPHGMKTYGRKWNLGSGEELYISDEVKIDGQWRPLHKEPKMVTKGPKTVFQFVFPSFQNNLYYDPATTIDGTAGAATTTASAASSLGAMASVAVLAVAALFFRM